MRDGSLPPLLVPAGGLPRLMAFYAGTWQFGLIAGPASSGFLYDVDPAVPYAVAAVCFAHGWRLDGWERGRSALVAAVSPVTP